MKKKIALVLIAAMSLGLLTGCGGDSASEGSTEQAAEETKTAEASGDKIEIEFWHSMGSSNGELLQEIVDEFNASQDRIYVNALNQGSYTEAGTKLQAALSAGEAPVIAQMEIGNLGLFADAGQLVNLQTYVDADPEVNFDDFLPGLLDASYYNDELIALPHSRSLPVLYYNKDRFEEAGLDKETPPDTWDELKEVAAELSGDGVYGYSCPLDQWYYMALVMNAGGQTYNDDYTGIGFDTVGGTDALYLWKEMIDAGSMHIPSGQDYNSSEACRNAFAAGTAAMIMQSSAQLKGLEKTCEFEVGVGAIPMSTTRAYPAGGSNLMMFKGHSEEEEAAGWEFLKFMTNTDSAIKWANGTGYLPTRQSCMESETYKQMIADDPNLQVIIDNVQYCAEATFIPQYAETKEIIANEIQKCILESNYTPEQAIESLAERVAKLF